MEEHQPAGFVNAAQAARESSEEEDPLSWYSAGAQVLQGWWGLEKTEITDPH